MTVPTPPPRRSQRIDDFDATYTGTPPWDIGRPQPALVGMVPAGLIRGRVLDIGCGTGEHALLAAGLGLDATGVDAAPRAVAIAQRKARERDLPARFLVADALDLEPLGERFDTVLDCGLFHVFDDDERPRFAASLGAVVEPGGHYFMLCFSDREPGDWGPRRVRQEEIRAVFTGDWQVVSIEPAEIDITGPARTAQSWLATIVRG